MIYIKANSASRRELRGIMSQYQMNDIIHRLKSNRMKKIRYTFCISLFAISWNTTNLAIACMGIATCSLFPPLLGIILPAVALAILVPPLLMCFRADYEMRKDIKDLEDTINRRFSLSNH